MTRHLRDRISRRAHRPGRRSWLALALLCPILAGCAGSQASASGRPSGARAAPTSVADPVTTAPSSTPVTDRATTTPAATTTTPATPSGLPTPSTAVGELTGRTVVIDPGHNGENYEHLAFINHLVPAGRGREKPCNTTGTATAGGYAEAAFNYSVATDLRPLLLRLGARVVMTRHSNTGVGPCVNKRAAIGNAAHADAVIAIHADGGPPGGRGFQVIYPPDAGDTAPIYASSLRLAKSIHASLLASRLLPPSTYVGTDGYSQRDDLAGLNLSTRPTIFVELGNMNNPTDAGLQTQPSFREQLARALAAGLVQFLLRR
jgi:N-acetylmuramoyl-L-alanine amidase